MEELIELHGVDRLLLKEYYDQIEKDYYENEEDCNTCVDTHRAIIFKCPECLNSSCGECIKMSRVLKCKNCKVLKCQNCLFSMSPETVYSINLSSQHNNYQPDNYYRSGQCLECCKSILSI